MDSLVQYWYLFTTVPYGGIYTYEGAPDEWHMDSNFGRHETPVLGQTSEHCAEVSYAHTLRHSFFGRYEASYRTPWVPPEMDFPIKDSLMEPIDLIYQLAVLSLVSEEDGAMSVLEHIHAISPKTLDWSPLWTFKPVAGYMYIG